MKEVIIIVAAAEDGAMGLAGELPWHLPDDFKHFKQTTSGYPIIMGRKTLESFPTALPNRDHIVITRNPDYNPPFKIFGICHSIESALELHPSNIQFIVGGGEIYKQAMPLATKMIITRVHGAPKADTYFPVINLQEWKKTKEEHHPADERHTYAFTIETFTRR